jgi:carbon starvation protein
MSLFWIILGGGTFFLAGYFSYGRFIAKQFDLRKDRKTPACEVNDGIDFVPTRKAFLLGQHFSAIAAAGPIVGPILASLWFGWFPVLLWIVVGAVFFGAVHDFSSLVGSVRHRATSIVEMVKDYLGPKGHLFFLIFVWFSLIYVITAFADLTSSSFVEPELGGGVATSSILYLLIGVTMGIVLYRFKMPLGIATATFLPLVVLGIWIGPKIPTVIPPLFNLTPQQIWNFLLLAYCFVASVIPVWLLLQPRGYLGGFFLYATLALGVIGLFLGGEKVQYPAFIGFTSAQGFPLFPLLFVTVACGACSGFHGIVSSGTTSKQIAKETDCRMVGYGGMLLEGLVALVSLSTVMILAKGDPLVNASPDRIYAEGLSRFVQEFGIPRHFARSFILLAFTTFIYDTLDVATRLARYIFQELTGWKGNWGRMLATLVSLAIPLFCVSLKMTDARGNLIPAWKIFWTIFGTSNQLLAALTLMTLTVWLSRLKKPWWVSAVPMIFVMTMTLWSLVLMMRPAFAKLFSANPALDMIGVVALLLFILAALLVGEAMKAFRMAPHVVERRF